MRNRLVQFILIWMVAGLSNLGMVCAADAPLPTVDEVLKLAIKRSEAESTNDIAFKLGYYFVRSKVTEIRNAEGELKKNITKIRTNSPSPDWVVTKPEPLEVPAVLSPKQEQLASSSATKAVSRKFDRNEFEFNDDLVARYDFTLIGREMTNGCSTLVFDFVPKKKKLPENGIKDRVINRLAGRVWVDEREYAIMKCALHLIESINIVGGIVGEAQRFEYGFERERTEEGVWYVKDSKWQLEGREILVHRKADYHETVTEVRKVKQ